MLDRKELDTIIGGLKYLDWEFYVGDMGDGWYLQMRFDAPDSETGQIERQHCRKWYISKHMTETEVVDTAYKAVEAGVIHEMQEAFLYARPGLSTNGTVVTRYRPRPIRNPHMDVKARYDGCLTTEHRAPMPKKDVENSGLIDYIDDEGRCFVKGTLVGNIVH